MHTNAKLKKIFAVVFQFHLSELSSKFPSFGHQCQIPGCQAKYSTETETPSTNTSNRAADERGS